MSWTRQLGSRRLRQARLGYRWRRQSRPGLPSNPGHFQRQSVATVPATLTARGRQNLETSEQPEPETKIKS